MQSIDVSASATSSPASVRRICDPLRSTSSSPSFLFPVNELARKGNRDNARQLPDSSGGRGESRPESRHIPAIAPVPIGGERETPLSPLAHTPIPHSATA